MKTIRWTVVFLAMASFATTQARLHYHVTIQVKPGMAMQYESFFKKLVEAAAKNGDTQNWYVFQYRRYHWRVRTRAQHSPRPQRGRQEVLFGFNESDPNPSSRGLRLRLTEDSRSRGQSGGLATAHHPPGGPRRPQRDHDGDGLRFHAERDKWPSFGDSTSAAYSDSERGQIMEKVTAASMRRVTIEIEYRPDLSNPPQANATSE
jgi:hypothetical protein